MSVCSLRGFRAAVATTLIVALALFVQCHPPGESAEPAAPGRQPSQSHAVQQSSLKGSNQHRASDPALAPGQPRDSEDIRGFATDELPVGTPRTWTASREHLARLRRIDLQNDPEFAGPYARVLRAADAALATKPISVMDKQRTPPSGDKHDFYSVGKYWWPNPETENGLPYVRRDGEVNPEYFGYSDKQYINQMIRAVEVLALAEYLSGDERYGRHAATLIRTWFLDPKTKMNPNMNFAQGIPGREAGRQWGIMDSHNLPRVLDGFALMSVSGSLSESDNAALVEWFRKFFVWLRDDRLGKAESRAPNNHGTWYEAQILPIALFVGEYDYVHEGLARRIPNRVRLQFKEDGRQPHELRRTTSLQYSIFNLTAYARIVLLAQNIGRDLLSTRYPLGVRLERGVRYLVPFLMEQKPWPSEQIKPVKLENAELIFRVAEERWGDEGVGDVVERITALPARHSVQRLLYQPSTPPSIAR